MRREERKKEMRKTEMMKRVRTNFRLSISMHKITQFPDTKSDEQVKPGPSKQESESSMLTQSQGLRSV